MMSDSMANQLYVNMQHGLSTNLAQHEGLGAGGDQCRRHPGQALHLSERLLDAAEQRWF